jgi:hypothetical protein
MAVITLSSRWIVFLVSGFCVTTLSPVLTGRFLMELGAGDIFFSPELMLGFPRLHFLWPLPQVPTTRSCCTAIVWPFGKVPGPAQEKRWESHFLLECPARRLLAYLLPWQLSQGTPINDCTMSSCNS